MLRMEIAHMTHLIRHKDRRTVHEADQELHGRRHGCAKDDGVFLFVSRFNKSFGVEGVFRMCQGIRA